MNLYFKEWLFPENFYQTEFRRGYKPPSDRANASFISKGLSPTIDKAENNNHGDPISRYQEPETTFFLSLSFTKRLIYFVFIKWSQGTECGTYLQWFSKVRSLWGPGAIFQRLEFYSL